MHRERQQGLASGERSCPSVSKREPFHIARYHFQGPLCIIREICVSFIYQSFGFVSPRYPVHAGDATPPANEASYKKAQRRTRGQPCQTNSHEYCESQDVKFYSTTMRVLSVALSLLLAACSIQMAAGLQCDSKCAACWKDWPHEWCWYQACLG